MLHLCSGDCGLEAWRTAGLAGEAMIWHDSPAVGPWDPDPEARRRLRAEFWGLDGPGELRQRETQALSALRRADTAALWFTPEPWDQLALLWVVASLAGPGPVLEPVPLRTAAPPWPPDSLREAFAARRPLTEQGRREAESLWALFQAGDWPALRAWIGQGHEPAGLPHLTPALARVLEDRPPHRPGRTERQVRDLMAAGVRDLPGLMRALAELETPFGVAWYGDRVVARLMARG